MGTCDGEDILQGLSSGEKAFVGAGCGEDNSVGLCSGDDICVELCKGEGSLVCACAWEVSMRGLLGREETGRLHGAEVLRLHGGCGLGLRVVVMVLWES